MLLNNSGYCNYFRKYEAADVRTVHRASCIELKNIVHTIFDTYK